MAKTITLIEKANQKFTLQEDNVRYSIDIRETQGSMSCSITANEVVLFNGMRISNGFFLIPFKYLEGSGGNFIFYSSTNEIIYYTNFQKTQFLYYVSPSELEEYRVIN